MRITVVSHALVQESARARWTRFSERHAADVSVLVPAVWKSGWFGEERVWKPEPVRGDVFRVIPIPTTDLVRWGRYAFRSPDACLRELNPDLIYVIQDESTVVLQQMLLYRRLWAPRAKVVFFSWSNILVRRPTWRSKLAWNHVRFAADAAIAGNSDVRSVLSEAGFSKPIHVQTEIGVDLEEFHPDPSIRDQMRAKLGVKGFVIGYSGRLIRNKGVLDLVDAVSALPGEWTLVLIGEGELREEIEQVARQNGWHHRLRITGFLDLKDVPDCYRALDCLVLPSRTALNFKEQFGLVLAQAMACAVPVIGSDSGGIPETIGGAGLTFPEGDVEALRASIASIMNNQHLARTLAEKGYDRALAKFSAVALADESYDLFREMLA